MCIELFGFCHEFYGMTNLAYTFFREVLEGDLSAITVQIDTIVGGCVAVSG